MRAPRTRARQRGFFNFILPALTALAPAIGAIGGGLLGARSQRDVNEQNLQIAREQMAFNSAEANKDREFQAQSVGYQMAFQRQMADTTYQRAVGDMKEAGLNPMLAYSQGGAPSPSGASASGAQASYSSLPSRQSTVQAGLASAAAALQLANLGKQGLNIDADTELKKAQAHRESNSAVNVAAQTEQTITATIPKIREEIKNIQADTVNKDAQRELIEIQTQIGKVQQMVQEGLLDKQKAETELLKVQKLIKDLQVPMERAYSEKFKEGWGKEITPYLREVLQVLFMLTRGMGR